jgi:NifU-like protein involved in Fe-S cluster formation
MTSIRLTTKVRALFQKQRCFMVRRTIISLFCLPVLAEDAIKAALKDYKIKQEKAAAQN